MTIVSQTLPTMAPEMTLQILQVILALLVLWKLMTRKDSSPLPQPLITRKDSEYVPRHEFNRLDLDVRNLGDRVEKIHDDLTRQGEERAKGIHERLNLLIDQNAEIRGRLQSLTDHNKLPRPRP